jgi:SAM-dependent methyltransferase
VASDVDPGFLKRLRHHAGPFANVEVRRIDIREPIEGEFDLVVMFFVIHRLDRWRRAMRRIERRVAPGGSLFLSEFAGPSGIIYLANERGGGGTDPVSRMVRRYFELVTESYRPELKSTDIGPVRRSLRLRPAGHRDFLWLQPLTVAEVHHKIEREVYAPFFSTHPGPGVIERLGEEFQPEWNRRVRLVERIRVYRFTRDAR